MKRFFRVIVIVVLGGIAALLHMTLWKAWRAGAAPGAPIMGLMGRHGVTTVDPMNALLGMTMLFSAAFLVSAITLFPGLGSWLRRQRDARWPSPGECTTHERPGQTDNSGFWRRFRGVFGKFRRRAVTMLRHLARGSISLPCPEHPWTP
jgi:hypothetical protein